MSKLIEGKPIYTRNPFEKEDDVRPLEYEGVSESGLFIYSYHGNSTLRADPETGQTMTQDQADDIGVPLARFIVTNDPKGIDWVE